MKVLIKPKNWRRRRRPKKWKNSKKKWKRKRWGGSIKSKVKRWNRNRSKEKNKRKKNRDRDRNRNKNRDRKRKRKRRRRCRRSSRSKRIMNLWNFQNYLMPPIKELYASRKKTISPFPMIPTLKKVGSSWLNPKDRRNSRIRRRTPKPSRK